MFTAPPKLHITLMMLVLLNDDEKRRIAEDVEKMCSSLQPSLKNLPELTLQGLDIMNDDPTDVNVLYATVKDPSNSLQNFSDTLLEKLKPHPFTVDDLNRDSVKIHVTLMKTSADKQRKTRNGFDATKILEKYQDFYFGKFSPKSIHISARFNQDHSTGYYACLHEINL
ncbi:Activating signal cointegrator 1 complex subunit 1 [Thelohanellus kitauei]|uniref:Activating signal cointegrator 1 complex subunit 1 n=1 Tax=Thelohanellus kitauei TaxID=669202 RepID=A0A0C2M3Z3_THEKT|nr:Activating signal cointegrator 1 complex subunit 1 [Thelohanellus kitauei]